LPDRRVGLPPARDELERNRAHFGADDGTSDWRTVRIDDAACEDAGRRFGPQLA
jgi:hypothetical protein